MASASSCRAARTTASTERLWPRWITSAPCAWISRRMMLMAASWPSNRLAAVTKRSGVPSGRVSEIAWEAGTLMSRIREKSGIRDCIAGAVARRSALRGRRVGRRPPAADAALHGRRGHSAGLCDALEDRVAEDEEDDGDDEARPEQELGDADGGAGNAGEADHAGDQADDGEDDGPLDHKT